MVAEPLVLDAVVRMSRDIRDAAATLDHKEARFLVDAYYLVQENRIRADAQIRSMRDEPHSVLEWLSAQNATIEAQVKKALERYVRSLRVGRWLLSITGIGSVLAAGLLAHLDVTRATYAGQFWSFAGLNPERKWLRGQRRPYNADLKKLCFLVGESFVKMQSRPNDVYGKFFVQYKEREWIKNLNGELAEQARETLAAKRIAENTTAYTFYSGKASPKRVNEMLEGSGIPQTYRGGEGIGDEVPMLPPAHIHARARRATVKLFISHLHTVMYYDCYGKAPPQPYVIDKLGHTDYIPPPNFDPETFLSEE